MEVVYDEESYDVTDEMKEAYAKHGFIIVRQMFSSDEIKQMNRNYEEGEEYHKHERLVKDSDGTNTTHITWNFPGNDVFGMATKTQKLVETCAQLLGGEVYHFHSKLVVKHPNTEGQESWQQDYGYWYENCVPFPDVISAFVAIDPMHMGNGCLQVLNGSHIAGKIEHDATGKEIAADKERVAQLQSVCPIKYIEKEPGDVIFLHCNILYKSDKNTSNDKKMAFLPVYNRKSNNPVRRSIYPGYTPLDVVYNDAVMDCENYTDLRGKEFIDEGDPECSDKGEPECSDKGDPECSDKGDPDCSEQVLPSDSTAALKETASDFS